MTNSCTGKSPARVPRLGVAALLILGLLLQPACFWKLWSKEKSIEEKTFDVYGTVESIEPTRLVINTKKGQREEFTLVDSSIKGSDFDPGSLVHVYYKVRNEVKEITMVVEKVD